MCEMIEMHTFLGSEQLRLRKHGPCYFAISTSAICVYCSLSILVER